jgi:hypothetical protein
LFSSRNPKAQSAKGGADIKNVGKIARGNLHERRSFSTGARMAKCKKYLVT